MSSCIGPVPIAWLVVESTDGCYMEAASCFFNGCGDGGKFEKMPAGPKRTPYPPALALGLPENELTAHLRTRRELVLHSSTAMHSDRIQKLLHGGPLEIHPDELAQGLGVSSAKRVASAPVAFSCTVFKEVQSLDVGQAAFILTIVGIQVHKSVVVGSGICSGMLRAIAARDFRGEGLLLACEEHTMEFPGLRDSQGRWIVPDSFMTQRRTGEFWEEEILAFEPPLLPPLPFNPLKALVVPRPIGWISTRGAYGDNLAPYSFFGYLSEDVVFFGAGGHHSDGGGEKDALRDARETGIFCVNEVPWNLRLHMSASSATAPKGSDEFELEADLEDHEDASIAKAACQVIDAPYVANGGLHLECKVLELITLDEDDHAVVVVGQIVHRACAYQCSCVAARGGYMNYFRIGQEHVYHHTPEIA